MARILMPSVAMALTLLTAAADAQPTETKTASEMYWDAVRRNAGPIGFPKATPDDESTRRFHSRRVFWPGVYAPQPYFAPPPEPIYVPVYVPGPVVYVPVPAAAPAPQPLDLATVPPATTAPLKPQKLYVIPGCYGGNKPPTPEALPAGCDIKKLRVRSAPA